MGETPEKVDLTEEYEAAFGRHLTMLSGMSDADEVLQIGADCAARLELIGLMLPENLIASIAETLQPGETDEPAEAPSVSGQGDGEQQGDGEHEPAAESSS